MFKVRLHGAGLTSRVGFLSHFLTNPRSIIGGLTPSPASLAYSPIVSFVCRKPYPTHRIWLYRSNYFKRTKAIADYQFDTAMSTAKIVALTIIITTAYRCKTFCFSDRLYHYRTANSLNSLPLTPACNLLNLKGLYGGDYCNRQKAQDWA